MHRHSMGIAGTLLSLTLSTFSANALTIIDNPGFEAGLDGYQATGTISTVSEPFQWLANEYTATEGQIFARLEASGANTTKFGGSQNSGAILSTHIVLEPGEILRFDWAFIGAGENPAGNFALLRTNEDIRLLDGSTLGEIAATPWQTFSWSPAKGYNGKVEFVISGQRDNPPLLLLDNLRIASAPTPEGATSEGAPAVGIDEPDILILSGLGLLALLAVARRRSS